MSDAALTNEQALKVLIELESNASFRQRYEDKPAAALLEIGIPAATIANLPAACLVPHQVLLKNIASSKKALASKTFSASASMAIPTIRMSGTAK
jgi:putative modified peptide